MIKVYPSKNSSPTEANVVTGTAISGNKIGLDTVSAATGPDGTLVQGKAAGVFANQSTTTVLLAAQSFNGPVESAIGYGTIRVTFIANVAAGTNGVQIRWYADAAGAVLLNSEVFNYAGNIVGATVGASVKGPYFSIVYVNGATNQAFFRLTTIGLPGVQPSNSITGLIRPSVSDALLVRLIQDRLTAVAGRTFVKAFITNVALGAGTTIWTVTANKTFWMTSASVTAVNTANLTGSFVIQDGADATDRIPFVLANNPVGGQSGSLAQVVGDEFNPIPFTTDVRAISLAGTNAVSITIFGYEQDT